MRLGIHAGLVVAGDTSELPILGELNLAARLKELAEPGTIIISSATYRLVQRRFHCQVLGSHSLGGVSQPVVVYRVLKEQENPYELTPLVGRQQEMGLLLERWAQMEEGLGQVVVLNGEPGIGKSRLVQEVKTHVAGEPHTELECRCWPYYQNSAFYPVIDLLQRVLQLQREDSAKEKLDKLEGALAHYHMSQPDIVPLLASLLSLPLPEHYAPLMLNAQQQRQKTLEALLTIVLTLAANQPVLFIVEDLHWVDPSTLELLNLLIDYVATAGILILLTSRPEFRPPWGFRAHVTPVTLNRLPRTQVEAMVARVAGNKTLPTEVHQQLVIKTDGVPLFVEELTKMVLESGLLREQEDHYELTNPLPPLAIPTTLRDSLEARLDRLAAVKEVAQLGAILGREFSYELLQAISPLDEPTLQHGLSQLVEAELLYRRGLPPQVIYTFKHALIQEAAYQSLLKRTRQEYHQRIAHVLAERFPQLFPVLQGLSTFYIVRAESRMAHELAEELLRLAQRAQDAAMLVAAYSMLGTTSFYLGENASARVHLEQGVALYDPQQHRSHAFLDVGTDPGVLCFIYAAQVLWLLGYPDQALTKSHEALSLAQELSHPFSLAYALDFAALLHRLRREEQAAQERAEAAMTLSTEQGFPLWLAIGMILRGGTLAEQGQGVEGMAQMREGLAVFQATGAAVGRPYFLTVLAEVYGRGGQAEERLSIVDEALAAVQKTGERWWEAELYRLKGVLGLARLGEDYAEAEAYLQHAIDIARLQQANSLKLRAAMSLSRLWPQRR